MYRSNEKLRSDPSLKNHNTGRLLKILKIAFQISHKLFQLMFFWKFRLYFLNLK